MHTELPVRFNRSCPRPNSLVSGDMLSDCWGGRPHGIACQNWGCEQPKPEPSMTQYKRIAIDTSKAVFTLHCIDGQDRTVLRTNLRRGQLLPFCRKLAATEIAMESCGRVTSQSRERIARP